MPYGHVMDFRGPTREGGHCELPEDFRELTSVDDTFGEDFVDAGWPRKNSMQP